VSDERFDSGGLRRYAGTPRTPLLQRVLDLMHAEKDAEFAYLQREPIPWCELRQPLERTRVALITTGGLHRAGEPRFRVLEDPFGDTSFRVVPHGTRREELDLEALYVDRKYTTDDPEVALPMKALEALHRDGKVGAPAARHYSFCAGIVRPFPGLRESVERLAPLLAQDEVGAVILLPTCATCVQTVGLLAGELEERGFPTVALSLLPELSEIVGVPRTLALHFPFGAPCGDPGHGELHRAVLSEALELFATAREPGEIRASSLAWRRD
jgi:glycine/betaine/sarcosine/D-proline reductase family selenoprotein B